MKFEQDEVSFLGGVRHGVTQGGPVAIQVGNTEWPKWEPVMAADPVDPDELAGQARNAPLTRPRPGHADLVGMQKYGFDDARPVLERASARETAARVALGTVAKAFLAQASAPWCVSHVVRIGTGRRAGRRRLPARDDGERIDADPVRCFDPEAARRDGRRGRRGQRTGDTLGGVVEVVVHGLPPGLGSHVHWDRRLDARLAGALMGIQAIKGVEVGDGFGLAAVRGSAAHDEIEAAADGRPASPRTVRRHRGRHEHRRGAAGARRDEADLHRAARTGHRRRRDREPAKAIDQRSDACAVPAAAVVAEAMVALVLADAVLEKFGGDSVAETARNVAAYRAELGPVGSVDA